MKTILRKWRLACAVGVCLCSLPTESQTIAPYWGNRSAALSLTFDDGLEEHFSQVFPQLQQRGLKASFCLVGQNVDGNNKYGPCLTWAQVRAMSDAGMEMTNHGWAHQNVTKLSGEALRYEIEHNDTVIWRQTGRFPRTFFYQGNRHNEQTIALAERNRVGTRTRQVSLGSKRSPSWFRQQLRQWIDTQAWGITMTHGISYGYDHFVNPDSLWRMFDDAAQLQDTLWIATFQDVAAYLKERNAISLKIRKSKGKIRVRPRLKLSADLFQQELTLLLPDDYNAAEQDGRQLVVYRSNGKRCVNFNPHGGTLTLFHENADNNGPTMGWSSWNTYRVHISDSLIMRQADAMVATGLADAGYRYVNIDDGYFGGRAADGTLLIHPIRFPNGLKPVVDHIHSLHLKAGIYSDAGRNTCGNYYDKDSLAQGVGLYGHDQHDADFFFKDMGFDFIKVDFCGGSAHQNTEHLALDERERYTAISQAIKNTGRNDVRLNICRWDFPGTWVSDVAFSWRISHDISNRWTSVSDIIQQNLYLSAYANKGHFNDMDMLEVGRSLTIEEDRTHFGLWCLLSSPLLIGCDLMKIRPVTLALLKNPELIAVNQDPLYLQAYVANYHDGCYLLVKDIRQRYSTARVFAVYNASDRPKTYKVSFRQLDLGGKIRLRNLYEQRDITVCKDSFRISLPAHATRMFRADGEKRLEQNRYEAEAAYVAAYQEIRNNQVALTAVCESDTTCSGGHLMTWLGGSQDNALEWKDVFSRRGGTYTLTVKWKSPENRSAQLLVNNVPIKALSCSASETLQSTMLTIHLNKGVNHITLCNPTERMPDVDCLLLERKR